MPATNELLLEYKDGITSFSRRGFTILAQKKIYKGALAMMVNGKLQPLVSGTALKAVSLTIAGADANGGLVVYSKQTNVRVQLLAGNSKTLGVTVSLANAGIVDVIIQQGTDNAGATTSTASQTVDLIRASALVSKLISVAATGTGAGLTATAGPATAPFITLMGMAMETVDNAASGTDLSYELVCTAGIICCNGKSGDVPTNAMIGSEVVFVDDAKSVASTHDLFSLTGTLIDVEKSGNIYVRVN